MEQWKKKLIDMDDGPHIPNWLGKYKWEPFRDPQMGTESNMQ
jgi:hypothetical protein